MSYIQDKKILLKQAALSIPERAMLFNKRFRIKSMTTRILRRLYREYGITRKKVKRTKLLNDSQLPKQKVEMLTRIQEVSNLRKQGYDIVYVDEVMFTKKTILEHTWSNRYGPLKYDMSSLSTEPLACCVAVSERYGLDLLVIHPNSINGDKFREFKG